MCWYLLAQAKPRWLRKFRQHCKKKGRRLNIKISSNNSHALYFQMAFYIGKIAASEPDSCFHIIAKDTGFDPLKSKKILVSRVKFISEIPLLNIFIQSQHLKKRLLLWLTFHCVVHQSLELLKHLAVSSTHRLRSPYMPTFTESSRYV